MLLEPGIPGGWKECTVQVGKWRAMCVPSSSGAELGPHLGPPDPVAMCFSLLQMAQWRSPNQSPGEWDTPVVKP